MNPFDKIHSVENHFAKSNPNYLKSMFGATDVMPLWIADMDFKIAEPITDELSRLVNRSMYAYEFNASEVFDAIANWNEKRHGLKLSPKSFVQVSGVLTGIAVLIRELTKEGDGVLVQSPVYHQFYKAIKSANRKIVDNPLKIESGRYQMDLEDLELKLKTKNVKVILLCNPHNPVGRVWKQEELQKLVDLANTYKATIVSDEIHADIIYSDQSFNSIASLANGEEHIAVLGSPAKTFGMQSIADGYLYVPDTDIRKQIKHTVSSMYLDHGNALTTYATVAAYTKGEEWLNNMISYLESTIDWVQDFVNNEMPKVKLFRPEGTYQLWMDFSELGLPEDALKQLIIGRAKLALTPGEWFGESHSQFMRMNIASPLSQIQEAFHRVKKALD